MILGYYGRGQRPQPKAKSHIAKLWELSDKVIVIYDHLLLV